MTINLNSETERFSSGSMELNLAIGSIPLLLNDDFDKVVGHVAFDSISQSEDGSQLIFTPLIEKRLVSWERLMKVEKREYSIGYRVLVSHIEGLVTMIDKFILYQISVLTNNTDF